eukprot:g1529.t1
MTCCPATNENIEKIEKVLESAQKSLAGIFDRCAACADAWGRVFCALNCHPRQSNFVSLDSAQQKIVLRMHNVLALTLWQSCQSDDTFAFKGKNAIQFRVKMREEHKDITLESKRAEIFVSEDVSMFALSYFSSPSFPIAINVTTEHESSLTGQDLGDEVSGGGGAHRRRLASAGGGGGGTYKTYRVTQYCDSGVDTLKAAAISIVSQVALIYIGSLIGNWLHVKHIFILPESGVFIILGMIYGAVYLALNGPSAAADLQFNADFLTIGLLPPIIFYSGFAMEHANFIVNLRDIIVLAVFGTLISTFFVGYSLWGISEIGSVWDFPPPEDILIWETLAFAALICAVDPVATLATFAALKVDPSVEVLVFGEALLNDAVAIVLFKSFSTFAKFRGVTEHFGYVDAFLQFLALTFGSLAIGSLLGVIHALTFKFTFFKHTAVLEIITFLSCAYASFLVAEAFHFSGIIASLLHGMIAATFVKPNMSREGHQRAFILTNTLASFADMMIFIMTGIVSVVSMADISWAFTLFTLILIIIGRAISVYPLVAILNLCRKKDRKIPCSGSTVLWFAGLRGAIAIGLCASVPSPLRQMMNSTTILIVLFTVFFMGGGTAPVLKALKIKMGKDVGKMADVQVSERTRKMGIALTKILCNYDEDGDGIDDRYETEEYENSGKSTVANIETVMRTEAHLSSEARPDVPKEVLREAKAFSAWDSSGDEAEEGTVDKVDKMESKDSKPKVIAATKVVPMDSASAKVAPEEPSKER